MKINDQQREILQAFLDGKTVKYRYKNSKEWIPIDVVTLGNIKNMEYRIEEPAVKVALFELNGRVITLTENENISAGLNGWIQISDWVEIVPNKEIK